MGQKGGEAFFEVVTDTSRVPLEAVRGRGLKPTSEAATSNPTSKAVRGCFSPKTWNLDPTSEGCEQSKRRWGWCVKRSEPYPEASHRSP